MKPIYDRYNVKIEMREKIYGGIPKDPELIKGWLKSRTDLREEELNKFAEKVAEEVREPSLLEEKEGTEHPKGMWTTFKKDDDGIYIEPRQIKASFKETANILGFTKKVRGFKNAIQHGVFVKPDRIHIGKEIDGFDEFTVHAMTAKGPRSALKRMDFLSKPKMSFSIWVASPLVKTTHLETMLQLGQENGLGAGRSQGYGQFDVKKFDVAKLIHKVEPEQ